MKNFNLFTVLVLIFSSSCSHVSQANPKKNLESIIAERVLENDEVLEERPSSNENTHEIVEADVADKEIEENVGSSQIDEEILNAPRPTKAKSFLIPKNTGRMQFWVNYFLKKDRARFQRFINNGEEYRHHIESIFASYGLPTELYYVGLIESGYYLGARSRASAVGPWQFISGTGKRYGLKISYDIDERRDLFKATHAAARYLRDLHNVFSSWELALSAYNAGEYGILRRIMKHKTRDYYQLSKRKKLPSETINYVPKVLAAMHIIENADRYGFDIPTKSQRVFDKTELHTIGRNISLREVAKELKISTKLLKKLNPELKRGRTPRYYSGNYQLRVPTGLGAMLKAPKFRQSRKDVIRRTASYYKVRRGDTLTGIARRYGTSAGRLARLNNFRSWKTRVRIGQRLKVNGKRSRRVAKSPIVYRVKSGDNLTSLANLFKIRVSSIKRANNLRSSRIFVGQKLVLPNTNKVIYTVRPGDYLSKIARKFKQPMAAILKLNALKRKTIFPGQKIIVDVD